MSISKESKIGIAAGLLIGLGLCAIQEWRNSRVQTAILDFAWERDEEFGMDDECESEIVDENDRD